MLTQVRLFATPPCCHMQPGRVHHPCPTGPERPPALLLCPARADTAAAALMAVAPIGVSHYRLEKLSLY